MVGLMILEVFSNIQFYAAMIFTGFNVPAPNNQNEFRTHFTGC